MTRKWSLERQWGVDMAVRGSTLPTNGKKIAAKAIFYSTFALTGLRSSIFLFLRQMKWTRKIKQRTEKNKSTTTKLHGIQIHFIEWHDIK